MGGDSRQDSGGYRALTEGCALVERTWREAWVMSGADRRRFLNGLVTCALGDLEPGAGSFGFVTTGKGRIVADLVVLAGEEDFLLELPVGRGGAVSDHVLRYRIADRVELEPAAGRVGLTLAGPRAADVLRAASGAEPPAAPWQHRTATIGGVEVRLLRDALAPEEGWALWIDGEARPTARSTVTAALTAAGAAPAALTAWEARRVERGLPRFGVDFDDANLPQETGLEEAAVSYDKGCYLGQEVVARIHYRGGVNKALRGLDLGAASPPAAGAEVLHDGRSAGRLGTAVASPALGTTLALAILQRRAAEDGTEVTVKVQGVESGESDEGGLPAIVRELPFVA